jgi:hypothetical protein
VDELKAFHVISVKLLIEQRGEDEGRAVSEQAQVAVDAACNLLQHVTGRDVRNRALVLEPVRLIEPAKEQ